MFASALKALTIRSLPLVAAALAIGYFTMLPMTGRTQDKKDPQPPIPPPGAGIPDLEKLLPPGLIDPEQMKQFKKAMDDLTKKLGNLPGLGQLQGIPGFGPGMPAFGVVEQENRLGATLEKPARVLVDQLDLPAKQGVVLKHLKASGAGAAAGLKTSDILLEFAGKPVPSDVEDFVQQLNDIKKGEAVEAVVLRKGKRETIKGVKLGDMPVAGNPFGGFGGFGNMPNFPDIQPLPKFQLPGGLGGDSQSFSLSKGADGAFTTRLQRGKVDVTVTGKIDGGKAQVSDIQVRDGDKTSRYNSVEEVPENYRDSVQSSIRAAETGGLSLPSRKDA
jgi:hypothetical protein